MVVKKKMANPTERRKVRQVARELTREGYTVQAEIRGRRLPTAIGPLRIVPDIVAIRNGQSVVVEVTTPDGLAKAQTQLEALADYVAKRADTSFRLVVTKPRRRNAHAS